MVTEIVRPSGRSRPRISKSGAIDTVINARRPFPGFGPHATELHKRPKGLYYSGPSVLCHSAACPVSKDARPRIEDQEGEGLHSRGIKRWRLFAITHMEGMMDQDQLDRLARLLSRISDRSERAEVTREIVAVLAGDDPNFGKGRFFELAGVDAAREG